MLTCPRGGVGRTSASLRNFLFSPPRTWFWCYYSLALDPAHQKKSPGVVALVPGATLHARLDTRMNHWGSRDQVGAVVSWEFCCVIRMHHSEATRAQTTPEVVKASIEHLTSYEGMGRAMIRCVDGCACEPQTIDAHRVDAHRNVSVFLQHTLTITGGSPTCGVQLQVLNESSSGGFKFKVRTITLTTI